MFPNNKAEMLLLFISLDLRRQTLEIRILAEGISSNIG